MHAQAVTDLKVAEQESTKASTDVNDLRHSLAELQEVGDVGGVAGARSFVGLSMQLQASMTCQGIQRGGAEGCSRSSLPCPRTQRGPNLTVSKMWYAILSSCRRFSHDHGW